MQKHVGDHTPRPEKNLRGLEREPVEHEVSSDQQGQKEGHHIRDYQVLHHRGDHEPETKASGRVRHSLCY